MDAKFKDKNIIKAWENIIESLGLDPKDPNFKETPKRILKSYYEIFEGVDNEDEIKKILSTAFPSDYKGMVIMDNIDCYSMCPHHFLPVHYTVHVGYIADKLVVGASKMPRLVEMLAKRPVLQETFTKEIVDNLMEHLKARGAMAVVTGEHYCMKMRGIKKACSMKTSSLAGSFEMLDVRNEFLELIKLGGVK